MSSVEAKQLVRTWQRRKAWRALLDARCERVIFEPAMRSPFIEVVRHIEMAFATQIVILGGRS